MIFFSFGLKNKSLRIRSEMFYEFLFNDLNGSTQSREKKWKLWITLALKEQPIPASVNRLEISLHPFNDWNGLTLTPATEATKWRPMSAINFPKSGPIGPLLSLCFFFKRTSIKSKEKVHPMKGKLSQIARESCLGCRSGKLLLITKKSGVKGSASPIGFPIGGS